MDCVVEFDDDCVTMISCPEGILLVSSTNAVQNNAPQTLEPEFESELESIAEEIIAQLGQSCTVSCAAFHIWQRPEQFRL